MDVTRFSDPPAPEGRSPWLPGFGPSTIVEVVEPDPAWRSAAGLLTGRIRDALGEVATRVDHVGSTAVRGLPAKPILDLDLVVPDPENEVAYVPALERLGLRLVVREPWWYGHRLLRLAHPRAQLHVFGPDAPEPVRHRMFRDWLVDHPEDRDRYARAKRAAAAASMAAGEHMMQYNARKEAVVREIYARLFRAAGLLP